MPCPVPGPSPPVAARSQPCVPAAGGSPSRAQAACALAVSPLRPCPRANQQARMADGPAAETAGRREHACRPGTSTTSLSLHPSSLLRPLVLAAWVLARLPVTGRQALAG